MVCVTCDNTSYKSEFDFNNFIFNINYRRYLKMHFVSIIKQKKEQLVLINTSLLFISFFPLKEQ